MPATLQLLFDPATLIPCPCGRPTDVTVRHTDGDDGDVFDDGVHGTAVIERRCEPCNLQIDITVYV